MSEYSLQQYKKYQSLKQSVIDCYSRARTFKVQLDEFIEMKTIFRKHSDYGKLSPYYRGKLEGYEEALWERLQNEWVEFRHYYKSKSGKVQYVSKYQDLPKYVRNGNSFKSFHFWIGTNKPFGVNFQKIGE